MGRHTALELSRFELAVGAPRITTRPKSVVEAMREGLPVARAESDARAR